MRGSDNWLALAQGAAAADPRSRLAIRHSPRRFDEAQSGACKIGSHAAALPFILVVTQFQMATRAARQGKGETAMRTFGIHVRIAFD